MVLTDIFFRQALGWIKARRVIPSRA